MYCKETGKTGYSPKPNIDYFICGLLLIGLWMNELIGKFNRILLIGNTSKMLNFFYVFETAVVLALALSKSDGSYLERKKTAGGYCRVLAILPILILITAPIYALYSDQIAAYGISYWSRWFSEFLLRICILISIYCFYVLLGGRAVTLIMQVAIGMSMVLLVGCLARYGLSGLLSVPLASLQIIPSNDASNFLETNNMSYVLGLCFLYLCFFDKECNHRKGYLLLTFLFFFLAGKRIGMAAVLVSWLFGMLIRRRELSRRAIFWLGIAVMICCFLFLNEIYNKTLINLLLRKGISWSGRDVVYGYFTKRSNFGIGFGGWGQAAVSKMLENMNFNEVGNMMVLRGIHSDILKRYLDSGFLGFLFWCLFNLIYLPVKIHQKFGEKCAALFFMLILYAFITYLTDNTDGYFMVQVTLFLIPLAFHIRYNSNERQGATVV